RCRRRSITTPPDCDHDRRSALIPIPRHEDEADCHPELLGVPCAVGPRREPIELGPDAERIGPTGLSRHDIDTAAVAHDETALRARAKTPGCAAVERVNKDRRG